MNPKPSFDSFTARSVEVSGVQIRHKWEFWTLGTLLTFGSSFPNCSGVGGRGMTVEKCLTKGTFVSPLVRDNICRSMPHELITVCWSATCCTTFVVLTSVTIKSTVFSDVTPCSQTENGPHWTIRLHICQICNCQCFYFSCRSGTKLKLFTDIVSMAICRRSFAVACVCVQGRVTQFSLLLASFL